MENNFLAVNKQYFGMGLKSIDLVIIGQIEEFKRNGCECYITNEQLSDMFGESVNTIKRSIKKLEEQKIISRKTSFIEGNGRSNRQRILLLNPKAQWKAHNELTIMEGSNVDNGRLKNEEWKAHNEPIKDNVKENKKDNNIYNNNFDYLFGDDMDDGYMQYVCENYEANMHDMTLDEWAKESVDDFGYNEGELKAIVDYYRL